MHFPLPENVSDAYKITTVEENYVIFNIPITSSVVCKNINY